MSGTGERHKGIAIMKGGLDPDMVIDFAESREELEVTQIRKHRVYSGSKGRHSMASAALKNGVFVGGPDSNYVSEGIMLSKGKAESYQGHPILDVLTDSIEDPGFVLNGVMEHMLNKGGYHSEENQLQFGKEEMAGQPLNQGILYTFSAANSIP